MKVDIKKLPKSEVELTITVPYVDYAKWQKKALEDISKKIKVDGFRKGHVPENIVKEKVSEDAIKMATLDYVFPQTYSKIVQEHKINVIARPEVDIKKEVEKEGDDFVYVAKVAVVPEVKLGDYKKIKVAKKEVEVTKKSVDETIEMIMMRYAEWADVERKAKMGDRAELAFEGFDEEGKAIPNTASKNHPIVLGSKSMIPGFEEEVVGLKVGEEKEFDITFPKDYHADTMKGKKVKFKITLNRLEEKKEQKLDAEMVKKITGKDDQTVEGFKEMVKEDLARELEEQNKQEFENEVVEKLIKVTKVEVPGAMIEQEVDYMVHDQKQRLTQQGMTWDLFLKHTKKTEEAIREEYAKAGEERIKARLAMQEVIKDTKLEVSDKDIEAKITEMISKYPEGQEDQIRDYYKKDSEGYGFLKNTLLADKLFAMFTK